MVPSSLCCLRVPYSRQNENDSQTPGNLELRKLVGRSPGKPEKLKRKTAHARGERGYEKEKIG